MEQQPNPSGFGNQQGPIQKENPWQQKAAMDDVSRSLSEIASSIRILEDRYLNLRRKSQLTDQALIDLQKEYFKEKKHLNQELIDVKIQLQELIDDIKIMRGELKDTVKQKEITTLNKYLEFWEPLQFITRKEAEKILEKTN